MQANDDFILLLSKQFSGDITPAESAVLNDWLAQSPDNKQLATELRQVWVKTGGYSKTFSPNLDAAFQQVQARITKTEQPRAKVVPIGGQLLRIAAALTLLLAAVWAYREFSAPKLITAYVGKEEKQLFTLSDGSRVWLRQGATMEYPAKFSGSERRVKLSGEAYFEVEHQPEHPFVVDMPKGDFVRVLGTQFGVRCPENAVQTDVYVRTGKVLFSPKNEPKGVTLTARQKASYNRKDTQLLVNESATLNELAWQTGGLEFVKTPMQQVVADLQQHYNVKITLRNPAMRDCPHTALFTNQPIEKVLESLALTHQVRVTSPTPGQYELSGGNCQ